MVIIGEDAVISPPPISPSVVKCLSKFVPFTHGPCPIKVWVGHRRVRLVKEAVFICPWGSHFLRAHLVSDPLQICKLACQLNPASAFAWLGERARMCVWCPCVCVCESFMDPQVNRETTWSAEHQQIGVGRLTDTQQMEVCFLWEEELYRVGSCLLSRICSRAFWLFLARTLKALFKYLWTHRFR